jgi:SAM-dependent methyltransferase
LRAGEVAGLLRGAHRAGLLRALAEGPGTTEALAAHLGLKPSRVEAVLGMLTAHGVSERDEDGTWRLGVAWVDLVLGATPLSLAGTLGLGRVFTEQFEHALEAGRDYWALDPADRLEVATGISPDPFSPVTAAMVRGPVDALSGLAAALEAGGRMLELGCGLASRLCALLASFPQARAVGVELDKDLATAARQRALALGVADRLEVVVADATTYRPEGSFDLVNWSQFFFPEPTRAPTLANAFAALRPGGWVSMPVVWSGETMAPQSVEDQELAEMRLALDLWGVPLRSVPEVEAEVAAAGFAEIGHQSFPAFHVVRGRRPQPG